MPSQVVIEIPSSEPWLAMKGYLKQWKLELPAKFVVKKTNLREIKETLGRAQRIVMTHERSDEFSQMLESLRADLKSQTASSSRRNRVKKTPTLVFGLSLVLTCILAAVPAFAASDLTLFGAADHQGQLTLQGTSSTQTITSNLNPQTFGVFGIRYGHGNVIGGEHTFAYAPNFIESDGRAFIYHSNLRVQAPFPVIKPYGTAGLGWIFTSAKSQTGTTPAAQVVGSIADIGTKFAINYGGGVRILPKGPVGVQFDIRGYTLPSVSFALPAAGQSVKTLNQSLNFFQVGLGVVFRFGD